MNKQIASLQHPYIKHLVHLRQNSDYRYEHKSVMIEGSKMIREVAALSPVKTLIACDEWLIPSDVQAHEKIIVTEGIMKKISGMQSPEGLLAEIPMPAFSTLQQARYIVALDNINDPGNLGAILRTALAFGWEGVFLIGQGCDPFNEKALRAARGATFRMPVRRGSWQEFDALASSIGATPMAADLDGEPLHGVQSLSACMLVLGNEARGLSPDALCRCKKITLPMSGAMESLNVAVAGGILMYLLRH